MATEMGAGAPPPLRIWLVDDSDDFRELLVQVLGREPAVTCERHFSSVAKLLAALANSPAPDALLLDVEMPGMNGIEVLPHIRKIAPHLCIVMVTTFFNGIRRREALAAGASDFVLKLYSPAKMLAVIRAARQPAAAASSGWQIMGLGTNREDQFRPQPNS
jgi:DNA-binding NarL/FixJ family response regulator